MREHEIQKFRVVPSGDSGKGEKPIALFNPDGSPMAGVSAKVFEVTDLPIPSGTDWSGVGHQLGSFEVPSWGSYIPYKLFIELAAPLAGTDEVKLTVDDQPDYSVSHTITSCRIQSGQHWTVLSSIGNETEDLLISDTNNQIDGASKLSPLPALPTFHVGIHTTDATAYGDIMVVRARATFLII